MTLRTLPLDWLYTLPDGRGVIVWSCTSGLLVDKNKIVGPKVILDGLDRLARDIKKGM